MQVQLGGNEEQTGDVSHAEDLYAGILHWLGPDEAGSTVCSASRVSFTFHLCPVESFKLNNSLDIREMSSIH
jgi:hypothetical protein